MTAWNPEGRPTDAARIPPEIFKAASLAAFPGLPDALPLEQAERRVAAALNTAWPLIESGLRARLADALDTFADEQYPETVFAPRSTQPDGVAGTAMRHAYHQAARMIRDGWPDNEED